MVKVMRTTPLESEVNCGKKKAVSFRFFRAETLVRSGLEAGGAGGVAGSAARLSESRLRPPLSARAAEPATANMGAAVCARWDSGRPSSLYADRPMLAAFRRAK